MLVQKYFPYSDKKCDNEQGLLNYHEDDSCKVIVIAKTIAQDSNVGQNTEGEEVGITGINDHIEEEVAGIFL